MNPAEFRESVQVLGPLLPSFSCGGHLIDGRKRAQLAAEFGYRQRVIELDPVAVLRALWITHPDRALERAGHRELGDYARIFGVRALTVASYLEQQTANAPAVDAEAFGGKTFLVRFWWPPRLKHFAEQAARERGMNLSAFVREAVATHLARTIPINGIHELRSDLTAQRRPRPARSIAGTEHRPRQSTVHESERRERRGLSGR